MLELAGLAPLVEGTIDADVVHIEHLRPRPHPDVLVAACARLGLIAQATVTFMRTPAGVAAGRALDMTVVGVGADARGELLRAYGATCVVPSLGALLAPGVRAAA